MSRKKDSRKDGKKEIMFFDENTKKTMTQEEVIEILSNAAIKTIEILAIKESVPVEEFLQNEKLLIQFVKAIHLSCEKFSLPVEMTEKILNNAFQNFDKTAIIEITPVKEPAA